MARICLIDAHPDRADHLCHALADAYEEAAREAGHEVTTAPGVSAVITALSLAGLPTDRFLFAGFLPNQSKARKDALRELAGLQATLVFYESPKRIDKFLRDAVGELGGERKAAICS